MTGTDTFGGAGYSNFLRATNNYSGATNPNKTLRLSNAGNLQILNSGYSGTLLDVADSGQITSYTPSLALSGFNAASPTIVTADALQFQLNPSSGNVYPQVRGNSATPVINFSVFASLSGQTYALVFTNGGTTLSASTWTSFFTTNMGSGGDSAIINVQDTTNSRIYRVTFCLGSASGNGSGTIFVERLI